MRLFELFTGFAPGEKIAHFEVITFIAERLRVAGRQLSLGIGVKEYRIIGDCKNTGQFVGNHDGRGAQAVALLEYQVVE